MTVLVCAHAPSQDPLQWKTAQCSETVLFSTKRMGVQHPSGGGGGMRRAGACRADMTVRRSSALMTSRRT